MGKIKKEKSLWDLNRIDLVTKFTINQLDQVFTNHQIITFFFYIFSNFIDLPDIFGAFSGEGVLGEGLLGLPWNSILSQNQAEIIYGLKYHEKVYMRL